MTLIHLQCRTVLIFVVIGLKGKLMGFAEKKFGGGGDSGGDSGSNY